MTTLLLGATGLLGRAIREASTVLVPERAQADLAVATVQDWSSLLETLGATSVINAAAMARVDRCETEIESATAVNAEGPGRLASACADRSVPLVQVSTDYVFGDQKRRGPGPYGERARHGPVQTYGATKARGEKEVLAQGWCNTIARVSWLFGPGGDPFGGFVLGQVDAGATSVEVMMAQQSRPTWVPDLARWLLDVARALEEDASGSTREKGLPLVPPILHPTGGPATDRGTWARTILTARGIEAKVVDQGDPPSTLVAARPLDSRLEGAATAQWGEARGIAPILDWREGVRKIHSSA